MFSDDACVRLLTEGARSSRATGGAQLLDGVFRRMLDPAEFQRIVFPGLSAAERAAGPQSLQSLVSDARYADAVRALVPGATERTRKVLDAVKVRGAAEGDIMDPETEAALWPNVFQEAFAREVVALMNRISTAAHASQVRPRWTGDQGTGVHLGCAVLLHKCLCVPWVAVGVGPAVIAPVARWQCPSPPYRPFPTPQARAQGVLASPLSPMALWAQLTPEAVAGLMSPPTRFGAMEGFAGEGWPALYCDDADRLAAAGRLTTQTATVGVDADATLMSVPVESVAWLEVRAWWHRPSDGRPPSPIPSPTPLLARQPESQGLPRVVALACVRYGCLCVILRVGQVEECVEEYPALGDILERLHALPFELNRLAGVGLGLCVPSSRSTLLRRVEEGAQVLPK
jgi:hypothetical protein